ncbi:MAG: methylated-DNA--[protein]-cysteine S-methyltransferase [Intestinibacter bartlettii]|uniref:methylated-DNA--[protein]-cysteine S-methyltransferase n=1 Tax=Intestinibacter bartlettii TaxID=261299 RepID=UPI0039944A48
MYKKSYKSPLGIIYMRSDGENLTGLWFESSRDVSKHSYNFEEKDLPIFDETSRWLDIYFRGKNPDFTPKYKIENLTPFRSQVIDIMNKIPYGKTVTYNDIAKEIAQNRGIEKMSAQAVGGAVGWNPICIIVPCHRVVGTNGSLTGYGGGIQNKVKLLEIENNDMSKFTIPKKGTAIIKNIICIKLNIYKDKKYTY